jgi:DNA-binding response OmpR family regulator
MRTGPVALVVSRDRHLRKLLGVSLLRLGCDAMDVATGREGVRCAVQTPFDVVIVDLANDPSAPHLLRELREAPSKLRVLCLVGGTDELVRLSELRIDACLRKPFRLHELSDVIEFWLRTDLRTTAFARAALN